MSGSAPARWTGTMTDRALAIDIGGTKIAAGLVGPTGEILARAVEPTPAAGDEDVFAAVRRVVGRVGSRDAGVCGVGCGGPMSGGGESVSPVHIPGWREFPIRERIEELTGVPTFVDNDAKALALAEGWCGLAVDVDDFMAVVVSTGVGGGIVLGGRLLDGASGHAGHVGHVVVEPSGRQCHCGRTGCLTAEASGTAIAAATGVPAAEAPMEVVERTGRLLGRAVASVAHLLDVELVVVAGSVALGFGDPFFKAARDEFESAGGLAFVRGCRIEPAALGADGPIVGAAAVGYRGRWLSGRAGPLGP